MIATSTASLVETVSAYTIGGIELASAPKYGTIIAIAVNTAKNAANRRPTSSRPHVREPAEHDHAHEQPAEPGEVGSPQSQQDVLGPAARAGSGTCGRTR